MKNQSEEDSEVVINIAGRANEDDRGSHITVVAIARSSGISINERTGTQSTIKLTICDVLSWLEWALGRDSRLICRDLAL